MSFLIRFVQEIFIYLIKVEEKLSKDKGIIRTMRFLKKQALVIIKKIKIIFKKFKRIIKKIPQLKEYLENQQY